MTKHAHGKSIVLTSQAAFYLRFVFSHNFISHSNNPALPKQITLRPRKQSDDAFQNMISAVR